MRIVKQVLLLVLITVLSACSYSYDILIVNESSEPIIVRYKIIEKGQFDEPGLKSLTDWNDQRSIKRFWIDEKPWQSLPKDQYQTELGERIIEVRPNQVVQIEHGIYNPISERKGELTHIDELRIVSSKGEICFKGRLLLNQFQKDAYTFFRIYRDEIESVDLNSPE